MLNRRRLTLANLNTLIKRGRELIKFATLTILVPFNSSEVWTFDKKRFEKEETAASIILRKQNLPHQWTNVYENTFQGKFTVPKYEYNGNLFANARKKIVAIYDDNAGCHREFPTLCIVYGLSESLFILMSYKH